MATQLASVESSIILQGETLALLQHSDEARELERLQRACHSLQEQIAQGTEKTAELEKAIVSRLQKQGKSLHDLDCWEGQEAIKRALRRKENRDKAKSLAQEARIQARLPKPRPAVTVLPVTVYRHSLAPCDLAVALQAARVLKAEMTEPDNPAGGAPRILTSSKVPDVESIATPLAAPATRVPKVYLAAMHSVLSDGRGEGEGEGGVLDGVGLEVPQDYGLQAIMEQLQTMEGMLLTATQRRAPAVAAAATTGLPEIRRKLAAAKEVIVDAYRSLGAADKGIAEIESGATNTTAERDAVRQQFLHLISGRDEMPLTITARQDEVSRLTTTLLENRQELAALRKAIKERRAELAEAEALHLDLKNTPALAAAEEAEAREAARAIMKVEIKARPPSPPPGVVPSSPPTCVPRLLSPDKGGSARALLGILTPRDGAPAKGDKSDSTRPAEGADVRIPSVAPEAQSLTGPIVTCEPSASGYPVYFYQPRRPTLATTPREALAATSPSSRAQGLSVQTLKIDLTPHRRARKI